ncbi:hypothetical protein L1049_024496 [Liquidambar formosana]|uniref:Uncharacterized protein n=1 Tax=Liquidambar formosana TaxID=63359 RepID=A0AAP0S228_LIQFO
MQAPISRPALEENIVLGVALKGSKRTLPIDDGMAPPPAPAEGKELAARRGGNGSQTAEKDKKDNQSSSTPSATPSDQSGRDGNGWQISGYDIGSGQWC